MMDLFLLLTPLLILGVLALVGFLGCDQVLGLSEVLNPPTFDPPPMSYASPQSVTISAGGQSGTIYYSTDGSVPDRNSTEYENPITVAKTTTIQAILIQYNFGSGHTGSEVATGEYVIAPLGFVQATQGAGQGAVTSVSVAFRNNQAAGDLNVVVVSWMDNTASVNFVQDSNGNGPGGKYTLAVGPTAGNGLQQSIYYAPYIAAGHNIVTVSFNGPANNPNLQILEYSGLNPISPVDVTVGAAGSGIQADTGFVQTTFNQDLLFAAAFTSSSFEGGDVGYTSRFFAGGDLAQDQIVNVVEQYNATATLKTAGNWVIQLVAFKG